MRPRPPWDLGPRLTGLGVVVCLVGSAGAAEPPPPPRSRLAFPTVSLRRTNDLDGLYVTVGPVVSITHVEGAWVTAAGAELAAIHIREHAFPAALGLALGGVAYGARDGGRVWLEAEVAVNDPLPIPIGLALGVAAEVDQTRSPRRGVQATLWAFAGLVPFVRVGTLELEGTFVEAGVMIKIPIFTPSEVRSR